MNGRERTEKMQCERAREIKKAKWEGRVKMGDKEHWYGKKEFVLQIALREILTFIKKYRVLCSAALQVLHTSYWIAELRSAIPYNTNVTK